MLSLARKSFRKAGVKALIECEGRTIFIDKPNGRMEHFAVAKDIRHGKNGFRVLRYTPDDAQNPTAWDHDGTYLFYENLDQVATAIKCGDYDVGRMAF